jgi:hypothetical protein
LAFVSDGRQVKDGLSLVVAADTSLVTRRRLVFAATLPAFASKVGGYPKMGRSHMDYVMPFLATDGRVYMNRFVGDFAFHPEFTKVQRALLVKDAGALLLDADTAGFWQDSLLS